ncbi:skeleton-binding protein 1, putative [Plasmodium knowlesi strain H]|uniref:Skeleton-binding protein 1, putative n=3 Tax=Plasmodium knowlesi TaxID=5850 RepID=A0A5K1UGF8_PLAKH|nr:skeleton-binding protein 1 [Plasmodium knowlesi strain H]CAA9988828.1 skeleton-binding protein 1 [Plasmodium knowlesi strain H]SBO21846.1 skeleton-binding protein 1, putative [Plasmodium knowlesi strain H]SBO22211.1 skeleton-binding protein 1, putative [Plasmodium knowlesi strain H]VVS78302.1 skeleton-binding protein 1 [Plasmodium knowlesi strain H]|eukprot:XP_002259807.1 hypothetical protein, conserved in Plasmodium species [Plasmodium knowlesi strain H]
MCQAFASSSSHNPSTEEVHHPVPTTVPEVQNMGDVNATATTTTVTTPVPTPVATPAPAPTPAPVTTTETTPPAVPDVPTNEGAVEIGQLSNDVVADLASMPDEATEQHAVAEEPSEVQADAPVAESAEEETILAPPNLDEMFSEESIRKLRESIENSPCYQRRLAAYREQQERLGKSIDISPSSPMISPLYKLQFFGSYAKGMIQLIQKNYLMVLLIGLFIMNGILFYNYYKGSAGKKKCKEEKLKKKMKAKCKKLDGDAI